MKKKLKLWLLFFAVILCSGTLFTAFRQANAATPTDGNLTVNDFYFLIEGSDIIHTGGSMELTTAWKDVEVMTQNGMQNGDTVEWSSSNENIVSVAETGRGRARITRTGPGYAKITARITRGSVYFSVTFTVKVDVKIKDAPDSHSPNYTEFSQIAVNQERAIVLDYCPNSSYFPPDTYRNTTKIWLQYTVNHDIVDNQLLTWTSRDETIVKVDQYGNLTATGAGKTTVHISTNTREDIGQAIEYDVNVIVNPLVNTNVFGTPGAEEWTNRAVITGSSDFIIQTNTLRASNLEWVVTDSNGNVLPENSEMLQYKPYTTSGSFEISNAKVGIYYIKAFAPSTNAESTNVKYLDLTVIVPFTPVDHITMNVTDTYDLVENFHMATRFTRVVSNNENIVSVHPGTQVLTAKNTGVATISITYKEYQGGHLVDVTREIRVEVIDALALNLSDATIYSGGTVKLEASVTDITAQLEWVSSNPSIATVNGGVVVGVTPGETTITVSTTIKGVYKSASCKILVLPAITEIKIDPANVTMNIGELKTLQANITPVSLNNVELKWISSNTSIVQIVENGKKFATIKAIAGGRAVITAINQNNVVVGFCDITVNQPVTGIVLSETNVTISLKDGSFQLRATVSPAGATNQSVKYTSTNASVVRVDSEGKVTLVSAGTASIIVTSVDNPSVSAICNVTVTTPVTGVTLDDTKVDMVVGETKKLTFTLIPTTATNKEVTWSSSDTSVCSVSSTGTVTAISAGNAIITITTNDGKFTKTCTITVGQFATALTLDKKKLTLNVNENYTFKVTTTPIKSTDTLTWESSNTAVATVSKSGKVTAVAEGSAIIIVKTGRGITAYCDVKVQQQATGITLNYSKKTITVGNTATIKATVLPVSASNQKVTWESSDPQIASVSSKGKVKGLRGGTAIITAKSVDGSYEARCIVTVKELVTSIKMPNFKRITKGKSYRLVPKITTNNATTTKLVWVSSNTKIATVDKTGNVKAIGYGKAVITAKAVDGSGASASCTIRVIRPVKSLSMNTASVTILEGKSKTLKVKVNPSNATYKSVTWKSSDESIAFVDSKGKVTAVKPGMVSITATSTDGTKKKAKCIVTVQKKVPATGITVAESEITMVRGESKTIEAMMSPANSTDHYTWSSDNNAVATVNKSSGRIVAKQIGTATITVMTGSGRKARITVKVVGLSKTSLTLEQYSTHTLWVNGDTTSLKWDVENPNIATVVNGKITTRATGKTNIVAIVNGRRLYCKLTVTKIK